MRQKFNSTFTFIFNSKTYIRIIGFLTCSIKMIIAYNMCGYKWCMLELNVLSRQSCLISSIVLNIVECPSGFAILNQPQWIWRSLEQISSYWALILKELNKKPHRKGPWSLFSCHSGWLVKDSYHLGGWTTSHYRLLCSLRSL